MFLLLYEWVGMFLQHGDRVGMFLLLYEWVGMFLQHGDRVGMSLLLYEWVGMFLLLNDRVGMVQSQHLPQVLGSALPHRVRHVGVDVLKGPGQKENMMIRVVYPEPGILDLELRTVIKYSILVYL